MALHLPCLFWSLTCHHVCSSDYSLKLYFPVSFVVPNAMHISHTTVNYWIIWQSWIISILDYMGLTSTDCKMVTAFRKRKEMKVAKMCNRCLPLGGKDFHSLCIGCCGQRCSVNVHYKHCTGWSVEGWNQAHSHR